MCTFLMELQAICNLSILYREKFMRAINIADFVIIDSIVKILS